MGCLLHSDHDAANGSSLGPSCAVETRLCPGVGLASQQKGYPLHTLQAISGLSNGSEPHYCPWLTSIHVSHLVKLSMLLIGYSGSCGPVGERVTWESGPG